MNTKKLRAALAPLLLAACSSSSGEATIDLVAYGESFIEEGIPAEALADGWGVTFSSFEVALEQVRLGGHDFGSFEVELVTPSGGQGHTLDEAQVPAGELTDASFRIARIAVSGTATKDGDEKAFSWTFDRAVDYDECEPGPTWEAGGSGSFQLTIHADHLFSDSLVAEQPTLRFQAIADADTDGDGDVTRAELEAADIGLYDPGSTGDVANLWEFLVAQSASLGHVNGEGHCHSEPAQD